MENNITDKSEFLLLGDFNIHINKLHEDEAVTFHDFLGNLALETTSYSLHINLKILWI